MTAYVASKGGRALSDDPWAPNAFQQLTEKGVAFQCPACDVLQIGDVAGQVNTYRSNDDPWSVDMVHALVCCEKCRKPALFRFERYAGEDWGKPEGLWPNGRVGPSAYIPKPLRDEFVQAQRCFSAKAFTASTVMVRRTLEGVCVEHGVTSKTLDKGLAELQEQGKLDGRLVEWANALRVLGNQAAHYTGTPVTREDAQDALDFALALLDYLYVLTRRFEQFQGRRAGEKG